MTTKKTLQLGKVAYCGTRKINAVELSLEITMHNKESKTTSLEPIQNYLRLSICGGIWNGSKTDYVSCGQNIDEIGEMFKGNKKVQRIVEIWKKWHLNDTNAGTDKQTAAIKNWKANGNKYEYTAACEYLKSIGLYEDRGYKYGHGWLVRPLPAEIINDITELFN